ncbi:MAG: hypothetical protein J1E98_14570, partial [Lachnospiraceae bacterium]|nr:hypothetical protein [Lachnospiraceae bacterium]
SRKGAMSQDGDFAPLASVINNSHGNAIELLIPESRPPANLLFAQSVLQPSHKFQFSQYTFIELFDIIGVCLCRQGSLYCRNTTKQCDPRVIIRSVTL